MRGRLNHIVSFLLSSAVSTTQKNMSGLAQVLVVVLAAAATLADPEPGYPAPCYDKTAYITKLQHQVQEYPVYSTIYKQQIVPTTLYRTNYNTLYTTVYDTQYVPKYVTETVHKTQVKYVTQVQTQYQTQYQTHYVTTQQYVPKYVTQTQYITKYDTQLVYNTVYTTQYTPVPVLKTKVQYQTNYHTEYVPQYVTVTKDKIAYVTDCPKPAYGYGY
ncbi:uncharacterized protein LOC123499650 [Portunus trituberculatus]|nr:uncharacterized protein LOC123499650 [Portunus trituberculatus]